MTMGQVSAHLTRMRYLRLEFWRQVLVQEPKAAKGHGQSAPAESETDACPTLPAMRRLLLLALIAGLVLRKRRLDAYDREHGLGAYAPVKPVVKESAGG